MLIPVYKTKFNRDVELAAKREKDLAKLKELIKHLAEKSRSPISMMIIHLKDVILDFESAKSTLTGRLFMVRLKVISYSPEQEHIQISSNNNR